MGIASVLPFLQNEISRTRSAISKQFIMDNSIKYTERIVISYNNCRQCLLQRTLAGSDEESLELIIGKLQSSRIRAVILLRLQNHSSNLKCKVAFTRVSTEPHIAFRGDLRRRNFMLSSRKLAAETTVSVTHQKVFRFSELSLQRFYTQLILAIEIYQ
jgi:hypothetical protein